MPFQAAVQGRARQVRDGRLQAMKAVVQRQQRVPAESDDDGLFFCRQDAGVGFLGTHASVGGVFAGAPLLDGGWADAVAPGERPCAFLT